jgi:DNA-directed RNA polymerase subunit H
MTTPQSNSSSLISSIYKSRKTLLELMKKQNYNINDYENFSINEVNSMYQNKQLDLLLEKNIDVNAPSTERKKKIYISYYLAKTLRQQNIQEMIDDLFNLEEVLTKEDTLMIIVKEDMNETMTNFLKHIWEQDGILIIIQNIKRLQFNILEHVLVPEHRVLTNEEVNKIKLKYNITDDSQFPDISRFDPVAQIIGIRPGQICEIIRPSKTAIQSYYYRICV